MNHLAAAGLLKHYYKRKRPRVKLNRVQNFLVILGVFVTLALYYSLISR